MASSYLFIDHGPYIGTRESGVVTGFHMSGTNSPDPASGLAVVYSFSPPADDSALTSSGANSHTSFGQSLQNPGFRGPVT